jgi:hypothetical protein
MKRLIQLFLFFLIIIIIVIFYNYYFTKKNVVTDINVVSKESSSIESENNIIKNLKYNIKLSDNSEYIITSEISEIEKTDNIEMVSMNIVEAKFIDSNDSVLIITSDEAKFNSSDYDTKFSENVKIIYLNHVIYSEKLDLNLSKNNVLIHDNVIYQGVQGNIKADNMVLDLITKNVEIFMDSPKDKIIGNSK